MEINSTEKGQVVVLHLGGRFDAHEVDPVSAWMDEQTGLGRTRMIIDLAGVNFVDSTALSTLVRILKRCRERNGNLRLCGLQQSVRVIFELTRLDKAFDIFPGEAEALENF